MPITRLSDLADPALCPCLVVKVGSALLVGPEGVRAAWIDALVDEIAEARARGQQVIVVSSGAIALGAATLGLEKGGRGSLADAQASAAVGQIALSGLWSDLLVSHGITAAQMLLTLEDLEDRRRYLNVTATLSRLLDCGAVPVINENDSVATQEIRFGDNDRLAARVAQAAGASAVVLLSDIDGLYDRHPKEPGAQMVPVVAGMTDAVRAMASAESSSGMGSGGMISKLQAAEIAELAGIAMVIGSGQHQRPLARIIGSHETQDGIGTLFRPMRRAGARKAWLGGRLRLKGTIVVDAGAAEALGRGASLLAKGVTGVSGTFERGDAVAIEAPDGRVLAHGLSEYDARECAEIRGLHSNEQAGVLGYAPRSSVVHRDQMVMK
ncbi:glutamate 5-kinase [Novosphingobium sp. 9]|uniref:glutamate 5-kinase n=1 Tax=Novosphingobium sp. 9 TaxID=2025349 RepID=UPI0021B62A10|nr:glutamate 5-kinase [Novosphingobium sp. 9]